MDNTDMCVIDHDTRILTFVDKCVITSVKGMTNFPVDDRQPLKLFEAHLRELGLNTAGSYKVGYLNPMLGTFEHWMIHVRGQVNVSTASPIA